MAKGIKGVFESVLEGNVTGKESKIETQSRRVWMQNFAAVSATGAVLWACGKKSDSATATPACTTAELTADQKTKEIANLNAAVDLENEAISLYGSAANLPVWDATANALAPTFKLIAVAFLGHHTAHLAKLKTTIEGMGGTMNAAKDAATYLSKYPGAAGLTGAAGLLTVLQLAAERELNAAKAYFSLVGTAAAPVLLGQDNVNLVASISPDESAHYGVLAAACFVLGGAAGSKLDQNSIVPSSFLSDAAFAVPTGFSPRTA